MLLVRFGFWEIDLALRPRALKVRSLLMGGLAADYCIFNTLCGALEPGYEVLLFTGAIRAANIKTENGERRWLAGFWPCINWGKGRAGDGNRA